MPELTPSFVMEYERKMRAITETEYARRLIAKNVWWNKVLRSMTLEGKSERITWILNTATIEPVGPSGVASLSFEDMVTQTVEYSVARHAKGIRVHRDQIEDLDGTGLNMLAEWSSQIGNEIAYYPQRLASQLILNGANTDGSANAYDGQPFFADNTSSVYFTSGSGSAGPHPNNPFASGNGYYANWLHGSSNANNGLTYPGALALDDTVTVDVALTNLGKLIAYVASLKMPNGQDPRFLTPAFLIAPPRMAPRIRELMKAKIIAQAATGGAGSADVEALITGWGLGQPIIAEEFASSTNYTNAQFSTSSANTGTTNSTSGNLTTVREASITGSDTSYYLVCSEMQSTQLGGLLHCQRKPFKVTYYTGDSGGTGMTAELDRANELEYHVQGRSSVQYGHPYAIFRIDNS